MVQFVSQKKDIRFELILIFSFHLRYQANDEIFHT
jgi:hypothetical protein